MTTTLETIELPLDELAEYSRANHIIKLEVFGSAARGEMTPESDVDLLVTFEPDAPIGLIAYIRIQDELGEIIGRRVDLVQPEGLKPLIKEGILNSAKTIYALN